MPHFDSVVARGLLRGALDGDGMRIKRPAIAMALRAACSGIRLITTKPEICSKGSGCWLAYGLTGWPATEGPRSS